MTLGARRAVCIESSPEAIAGARQNLALNGFEAQAEIRAENAFDELRRLERGGARFGVIGLDPPPFARSRSALDAATRGYKEINLRAMRLLERDFTSQNVYKGLAGMAFFYDQWDSNDENDANPNAFHLPSGEHDLPLVFADKAVGQSSDHPVLLSVPETRYLKGLLLEAL